MFGKSEMFFLCAVINFTIFLMDRLSVLNWWLSFWYNVVLRIKVTRYVGYISRKYLTPVTSRLFQSPAGEWLSPEGVLFIRYRDTGIQPSNRGASRSTLSDSRTRPPIVHHSTSIFVSVKSLCSKRPASSSYTRQP